MTGAPPTGDARDAREVQMVAAASTMFGCPEWRADGRYDVVFVGVPSDTGGLGVRSPAAAPTFLRTASGLFRGGATKDGRTAGFFDYSAGRVVLEGVRLADAGDLACSRSQGAASLGGLPAVYEALRATTRHLVILGGDHSIAYYLAQSLSGEALVWVDAHEDARGKDGPLPDCANVVNYVDELEGIPAIAQFGLRGLVPAQRPRPPAHRVLCQSVDDVVRALRERAAHAAALSIDVDVLDPSVMPAVGSPMPDGLRPADLLHLIRALRQSEIEIPVIELSEFAPVSDHDITSALVLVNFLLRALALCLVPSEAGARSELAAPGASAAAR